MSYLSIEGGAPLHGELTIQGSKNSVLPVLAATILARDVCRIENCPRLRDVDASVAILRHLGCRVRRDGTALEVDTAPMARCDIPDELMREMRSSIIFLGAILARQGEAVLSYPGGCELGPRPIDLHLAALRELGAEITERYGELRCRAKCLRGTDITLAIPSVGATENAMMAAVCAPGETVIHNAAREPEIADLIGFLRAAGADISGAGTSSLQICGVSRLHGATYTILPDRIETATYLCMAAGCGGETELLRCDARLLLPVIERLREAGCEISADADRIVLRSSGRLLPLLPVSTAPYPGFPTDAQALLMAAVLKAAGGSEFRETIFERRFLHVPELRKLGADIQVAGSTARVRGVRQLHGAKLRAEDLRGAAALLTASMMAEGESELTGLCHLLRGYEKPEQNLKNLGASIKSVDIPAPFVYNT